MSDIVRMFNVVALKKCLRMAIPHTVAVIPWKCTECSTLQFWWHTNHKMHCETRKHGKNVQPKMLNRLSGCADGGSFYCSRKRNALPVFNPRGITWNPRRRFLETMLCKKPMYFLKDAEVSEFTGSPPPHTPPPLLDQESTKKSW